MESKSEKLRVIASTWDLVIEDGGLTGWEDDEERDYIIAAEKLNGNILKVKEGGRLCLM